MPLSAQSLPEEEQEIENIQERTGVNESEIILGESAVPSPTGGSSPLFAMFRMVLVLALAALAIYGVVFFVKRISRPRAPRDPNLKILARVPLSGDSFAAVLALGAKAWLVGGSPGGVNLISEIEDSETIETMLLDYTKNNAEGAIGRFLDFRSLIKKHDAAGESSKQARVSGSLIESLKKQRERLKGL